MSKLHIVASRTNARADTGTTLPIPDAVPVMVATVAVAAASAVVATMPATPGLQCSVTAIGGAVWLSFGPSDGPEPAAGEGAGWLLQDGETRSFGLSSNQRLAAKDAIL